MSMTVPADRLHSRHRPAMLDALHAAWAKYRQRRVDLAAFRRVGRLGPRLMDDIGLDQELIDAAADPWDHLSLTGFPTRRR